MKKEITIRLADEIVDQAPNAYDVIRKQVRKEIAEKADEAGPTDLADQAYETWRDFQCDRDFMQGQEAIV